jgi:3-oxoacyl-[acyl-carrier protein] reductase
MPENQQFAVITGAGQGMGRAIALKLAGMGVHCVLVGRTAGKLEAVAREIEKINGNATVIAADLTEVAQVERVRQHIASITRQVDMLINCAGEAFIRKIDETQPEELARVLAINLTAPYLTTQALLPMLRRSPNASIVTVVSKVATKGYGAGVTAYTAAKTGLLGFTRALAAELVGEEIRVIALNPGPVDTPMRRAATPHFDPKTIINAETIANLVAYVVTLPRGTTTGELLIHSMHYD